MRPPALSTLGVFHTFATVVAIYIAIDNLVEYGYINIRVRSGKVYWLLTAFGCISAGWLVARTGRYGPGHVLALLILLLLFAGIVLDKKSRRIPSVFQMIILTTTLFFSLIPSIMETLTRLPVSKPFAVGPEDFIVQAVLGIAFIAYLAVITMQIKRFRKSR